MTKSLYAFFSIILLFSVSSSVAFASHQAQHHQHAMATSHHLSEHITNSGHNRTAPSLETLIVTVPVSAEKLAEVKTHFKTVHIFAEEETVTKEAAREAEVWYSNYLGIPKEIEYEDVPNLKLVQLTSAGANLALNCPVLKNEEARKRIDISSASGIHAISIPQWIISQTVSLYMHLYLQTFNLRTNQTWTRDIPQLPQHNGTKYGNSGKSLYGKTAGLLGYGHIARETARLLKAFNVNVIAANSNGQKRRDDGYLIPGTGDADGSIPSAYYSTSDEESFKTFLSKSDILIASLPSTPQTRYLLNQELFSLLPEGAVFLNVGRGDLVKSEDLLAALASGPLSGIALDVTDPEPLPDNHPLYSHPQVIITPHTSSNIEGYFDVGADLLIENVRRVRKGGKAINKVDPEKGY
ncbi:oxidoreductase [Cryptococcus neoformans AD2-60a]|nr:oxidoreductase [Cryptococcus neoformans var. grubii AD2-60a]OXG80707.1 oxidoreductase [Cryptococcus neoformans var. grubii D17-1]OXG93467.1 oxidoreductase [Cryptococcus neoformans var. grubii A2-102-5]